mmetsp:Transcript_24479/g.72566  ORF Transcript_24479/g.72566 Transcript_24479/m.72566 type:complete len:84 (-) Transcript_24479:763-1014(-)
MPRLGALLASKAASATNAAEVVAALDAILGETFMLCDATSSVDSPCGSTLAAARAVTSCCGPPAADPRSTVHTDDGSTTVLQR